MLDDTCIWTVSKFVFYHNWQSCRNLIGQFAIVDKSKDNTARVNLSRNGHALKESFYLTSILW